jgi:hypothetical protein
MLQKGDVVKVIDHSYHVSLLPDGKPKHQSAFGGIYADDKLIVVETNCQFPSYDDDYGTVINDTLLWNETKGYYIFFRAKALKSIGRVCPFCGNSLIA